MISLFVKYMKNDVSMGNLWREWRVWWTVSNGLEAASLCARAQRQAGLCSFVPCLSSTGKTHAFVRGYLTLQARNLLLSLLLGQPSLWGQCWRRLCVHVATARLNLGPVSSPTVIQLELVWWWLNECLNALAAWDLMHCGLTFPLWGASWYHSNHFLGFCAPSSCKPGGHFVLRSLTRTWSQFSAWLIS